MSYLNWSKLIFPVMIFAEAALCQVSIKGTVINTLGHPVPNAFVRLATAGLKDTSDSMGRFTLVSSSTENLPAPDFNSSLYKPFIKNNSLVFPLISMRSKTTIGLFSPLGRLLAQESYNAPFTGEFRLFLPALSKRPLKNAVYIIRIRVDHYECTLKWNAMGSKIVGRNMVSPAVGMPLVKKSISINFDICDTVIVTKDGYFDEYKNICSNVTDSLTIKIFNGIMPAKEEQDSLRNSIFAINNIVKATSPSLSLDSAMSQIMTQCKNLKMIDSIWINGTMLCAQMKNGGICSWDFFSEESSPAALRKLKELASDVHLSSANMIQAPACILSGGGDSVKKVQGDLAKIYKNLKIFYSCVDTFYNEKFTIDFITNKLWKYDLVYLLTHGMQNKHGTYFLTGEKADFNQIFNCYFGDWKNHLICINLPFIGPFSGADMILMVSNRYVAEKCDKPFNARLWYAATCNQLTSPNEMGKTLIDRGVKQFVGWNCIVVSGPANYAGNFIVATMLDQCLTLGEAYNSLPEISPQPWENIQCDAKTCYQISSSEKTGYLMAYPDDINSSSFKLRNDCAFFLQSPTLKSPSNEATGQSLSPTLSWSSVIGAMMYYVQVATDNAFTYLTVADSVSITPSMAVIGLSLGTTYYWRVRARNSGGTSSWSSAGSFATIIAAPQIPALVSPSKGAAGVSVSPTLSWSTVNGAAMYHLQVSTDNSFATIQIEDSTLTSTVKSLNGLSNSTTYFWRVRAKNPGGTSAWTSVWNFTTIVAAPPAPVLISPSNGAAEQPSSPILSWSSVTGATNYHVQLSTDTAFSNVFMEDSALTSTSKTFSSLMNSRTYFWRVRAKNMGGVSAWTNVWSFSTSWFSWNRVGTDFISYIKSFAAIGNNLFGGIYGEQFGVISSVDSGKNWAFNVSGMPSTNYAVNSIMASGTILLAGLWQYGIYRSLDNGAHWSPTSMTSGSCMSFTEMGGNFFAGTAGGILLSTDQGTSWKGAGNGLTNPFVLSLASNGADLFAGTSNGIFFSTDNGSNWSIANTGLPLQTWVCSFAIDGDGVFAATTSGVIYSTDRGANWTKKNTGLSDTCVTALALKGGTIFAGTNIGGVCYSTNKGSSWIAVNAGLPVGGTGDEITSLFIFGNYILASTYNKGTFRANVP